MASRIGKAFDRKTLSFRQDCGGPDHRRAHADLMQAVFDLDIEARDQLYGLPPKSTDFALFDPQGACVAAASAFSLPLVLDGQITEAAAIRSVAVDPDWRGQGLFRTVMDACLAWCEGTIAGPVLLYTEEHSLYERFRFTAVPQHRFVGPVSPRNGPPPSTLRLSLEGEADRALVRRLLESRTPVSSQVGLVGGSALFLEHARDEDLRLDYMPAHDALIVSEQHEDGTLTLVDVAAAAIPPLATILDALGETSRQVSVLFPPDKLDWSATPERDDTGLMIKGPMPAAFKRPFMLPPTAEF